MTEIRFTIDGKECLAKPGQMIVEAAQANGVYIPVLCTTTGSSPSAAAASAPSAWLVSLVDPPTNLKKYANSSIFLYNYVDRSDIKMMPIKLSA